MAKDDRITLYDLVLEPGHTISPFVWRTKYAVAHKGFALDLVPIGFTGIKEITGGFSERLPVIVDDGRWVKDSWEIAEYLDATYPDRPMLFAGASHKLLTKFIDAWAWRTAIGPWFRAYITDYHDLSRPEDRHYVRWSREAWFLEGRRLEEVSEEGKRRLPEVPPTLEPLRALLRESQWLGGETPNYTDFCILAVFLWTASVARVPCLHDDDTVLKDYVNRGFDLYGGLGRHPGMHELFGLPKSEASTEQRAA